MSKMVQKSKNLKKSQKISKIHFFSIFFFFNFFLPKKNDILLVFQYQEDAIRPELSSLALFRNKIISKNLKNSLFIYLFFFEEKKIFAEKKKQKIICSYFSNIRRPQFDQSSPVQPVSESRGGTLSVTEDGRTNRNPCV